MKSEFIVYGKKTAGLEQNLTPKEKKVLEDYKTFLSITAGEQKILANMRMLNQFRDVIEKPLTQIKRKDLEIFWGLVKVSEHEYNYKVMLKRAVKRFCKWYYKDLALIDGLEVGDFKPNRKKINKAVLLTSQEIERMLRKTLNIRDKAMLILMYESASRPQELQCLRWKDINFDTQEVHLDSSKTERCRDVPIKESIIHLKRWRQEFIYPEVSDEDFVFPSQKRERHLTTAQINSLIKKMAVLSKITKPITSYTLRHSRLTEIHKLGIKGLEHNQFAGHRAGSRQTTTYVHMDNQDMKEEVLKKVYHIEEITEKKQHELEKKIEKQSEMLDNLRKENEMMFKYLEGFENKLIALIPKAKALSLKNK